MPSFSLYLLALILHLLALIMPSLSFSHYALARILYLCPRSHSLIMPSLSLFFYALALILSLCPRSHSLYVRATASLQQRVQRVYSREFSDHSTAASPVSLYTVSDRDSLQQPPSRESRESTAAATTRILVSAFRRRLRLSGPGSQLLPGPRAGKRRTQSRCFGRVRLEGNKLEIELDLILQFCLPLHRYGDPGRGSDRDRDWQANL
jgi:hypothetical protein